ncbi:MAG: response regulator [Anaerolineales bacterium]|nr:response regulator [Anaerolineales bacterium]
MTVISKILIVDDNEEFCATLTDILKVKGHEVESVHNGFDALDAVKSGNFTLVLLDIKMPVMNGVETYKRLKQIAPQVRVIMMTAFALEDLIRDALREGAYGIFHKPIDFNMLFESIDRASPNGALLLVVDDNQDLCSNINDVFTEKGYRVSVAHDGTDAIQQARKNNFDILLIDMKMPVLNGLETYLAIRDFRPDTVALLMSAFIDDMKDEIRRAEKESAYVCFEKPLDMDQLLEVLESVT